MLKCVVTVRFGMSVLGRSNYHGEFLRKSWLNLQSWPVGEKWCRILTNNILWLLAGGGVVVLTTATFHSLGGGKV